MRITPARYVKRTVSTPSPTNSEAEVPPFLATVHRVLGNDTLRISERVLRQGERDSVLRQVFRIFALIPLEARLRLWDSLPQVWRESHIIVWLYPPAGRA